MSRMLASVRSLEEAKIVQDVGVDVIDLKDPKSGALGALDLDLVEKIVSQVNGVIPVSATIGDLPFKADAVEPVVRRLAGTGVDIIKIGIFGQEYEADVLQLLSELGRQGLRIVLVLFAEQYAGRQDLGILSASGISGLMLDTMEKNHGSLRDKLPDSTIRQFIRACDDNRVISGLAGSLAERDIAPLLELKPHYLGFRGGLCRQKQRTNLLDKSTVERIRMQIPLAQAGEQQTAVMI